MSIAMKIIEIWPWIGGVCFMVLSTLICSMKPKHPPTHRQMTIIAIIMIAFGPLSILITSNILRKIK